LFLSLLLVAPYAQAAGGGNEAKERAARKACLRGNTDKGVEILTDLYLDTKDATFIFNQGRCFEQNHKYEDAIARFREYLLKAPNITDADRTETQKHIADCQTYLGKVEARPRSWRLRQARRRHRHLQSRRSRRQWCRLRKRPSRSSSQRKPPRRDPVCALRAW